MKDVKDGSKLSEIMCYTLKNIKKTGETVAV